MATEWYSSDTSGWINGLSSNYNYNDKYIYDSIIEKDSPELYFNPENIFI